MRGAALQLCAALSYEHLQTEEACKLRLTYARHSPIVPRPHMTNAGSSGVQLRSHEGAAKAYYIVVMRFIEITFSVEKHASF